MRWIEITVEATEASADAVTELLIEQGCAGTASDRPSGFSSNAVDVKGYLPMDERLEGRLKDLRARVNYLPEFGLPLRANEIKVTWVDDQEWGTAWRKYFKPLRFNKVVIKPSWEEFKPEPEDIVVEIDPGMAFGTGSHATTSLCIYLLQEYIKGGEVVLDMGTGSGILAMTAAMLGAAKVTGYDNDTVAVDAAEENVRKMNLLDKVTIGLENTPMAFIGQADMVVANIIPNVIIPMAESLHAKAKTGGYVITSGIIVERAQEVMSALEKTGLETIEQRQDGEWVAIVSRRID